MKKICRVSGEEFEITKKDLEFYKKIWVPIPTLSPEERNRRRMSWRNDRVFYKRECDLSKKKIITMYSSNTPFPVYHQKEWWSDKWSAFDFWQDFNFSKLFFKQWEELMLKVPRLWMDIVNCENSDYCNYCWDDKNCYIDIAGEANENCYFNLFTKYSKKSVDGTFIYNSENIYESISCYKSNILKFCINLENCFDCSFSIDLQWCKNCFLCSNLRNKQYYIANKKYSKEEYFSKIDNLDLDKYDTLEKIKKQWYIIIEKSTHKYAQILNSKNCTGDNINNSKNIFIAFNTSNSEDSAYLYDVLDAKKCRDLNYSLYKPEMSLELISTLAMKFSGFSMASHYCSRVFYCDQCNNSSDLFWCIWLNNSQYCILNKQYTKEEYNVLLPKIIKYMKETKEWWEFFPISLSPFGYNETVAVEYFPLTKSELKKYWWYWKEDREKIRYEWSIIRINNSIHDVSKSILQKILTCENCSNNYRIVAAELDFYKKQDIPIPRNCPTCRHLERMKLRNPRKLFERECDKCQSEIDTTYSHEKKEKVYCEDCYNKEIY